MKSNTWTTGHDSKTTSSKTRKDSNILGDVVTNLLKWLVLILIFPVRVLWWLTSPAGSCISLGILTVYFVLVNVEGYYQSMKEVGAFLPKPFIEDGSLLNLLLALTDLTFWIAVVVSIAVQGVQSWVMRDIDVARAKAEYEAVKDYRVPDADPDAIDLAEYRRQRLKSAGMKAVRSFGLAIAITYFCDISTALNNYPLIGTDGVSEFVKHLVWCFISILGAELAANAFMRSLAELQGQGKPEVEVIN
ncbi:MAG TPA: hypothetical protein V6D29_00340 [Leptolyngbyaceae cyanobacterium]